MKKLILIFLIIILSSCSKFILDDYEPKQDTITHKYFEYDPDIKFDSDSEKVLMSDSTFEFIIDKSSPIIFPPKINISEIEPIEIIDPIEISEDTIIPNNFILEDASYGNINYIINDTMIVGKLSKVNLTLSEGIKREQIISEVSTFTNENTLTEHIRIAPIMCVTLIDPSNENFVIIPITHSEQMIENNEFTKWEWDVTPLKKGNNKLKLSVDIIYNNNSKNIKVYENFIYVYSDQIILDKIWDFMYNEWKWFLSTLLIPLGIFFYKKRKIKNNI